MTDEKLPPTATEQRLEVVDPNNVPVTFTDWIVTGGMFEGVVNLTLGTIDHSLKRSDHELARIIIAIRLRCSHQFAIKLHSALGNILGLPSEPSESPPKDVSPKTPSKNTIN
jgi:hypothetical protein